MKGLWQPQTSTLGAPPERGLEPEAAFVEIGPDRPICSDGSPLPDCTQWVRQSASPTGRRTRIIMNTRNQDEEIPWNGTTNRGWRF